MLRDAEEGNGEDTRSEFTTSRELLSCVVFVHHRQFVLAKINVIFRLHEFRYRIKRGNAINVTALMNM